MNQIDLPGHNLWVLKVGSVFKKLLAYVFGDHYEISTIDGILPELF